jgi:hypothetical protein
VPPEGESVDLRGNANLSTGGTAEDVTDLLPEETRDICIRAARTIGLDVAGIDIVCQDISQPLHEQRGGIIEVNAAPPWLASGRPMSRQTMSMPATSSPILAAARTQIRRVSSGSSSVTSSAVPPVDRLAFPRSSTLTPSGGTESGA